MEKFTKFARIAEIEFSNIVLSTQDLGTKLRIYLKDKSFIDFNYTIILKSRRFSEGENVINENLQKLDLFAEFIQFIT